jgi:hypothetical protein
MRERRAQRGRLRTPAVDANALEEVLEVRRGVDTRSKSGGNERGLEKKRGGPLPLCPCDMDAGHGQVRVSEQRKKGAYSVERKHLVRNARPLFFKVQTGIEEVFYIKYDFRCFGHKSRPYKLKKPFYFRAHGKSSEKIHQFTG